MLTRRQRLRCSVPATPLRREIRQEMFDIMITVMSLTLIALNNRNGCEVPSQLLVDTVAIVVRHYRDCWQVLSGLLTGTIVLNNSSNAVQTYTILRSMSNGRGSFECVDLMRFHINQHILPLILPLFLKFLAVFKRMIKTRSYPEYLLDGGAL